MMKGEVSNNVIAGLLIVAIVISVVGITSIMQPVKRITGAATHTGVTNLTVSGESCWTLVQNVTDFGSGSTTENSITITTDTINSGGFNNGSESGGSGTLAYVMILENCANTVLNITMNASKNATGFICGTGTCTNPAFKARATVNESGSCTNPGTNWQDVNETADHVNLCGYLQTSENSDSIMIHYNLTIPSDTDPGTKTVTVNVWGVAS